MTEPLTLRPYQVQAIQLIVDRLNVLLALVMGAGKSAVALRAIVELRKEEPMMQTTIFCTNSLKYQWTTEIDKWDPGATYTVIDGNKKKREAQYRNIGDSHYTILSYDMLIHDWDLIRRHLPYDAIIADEVTYIKGITAKRTKRLKAIGRYAPVKIGLSGQPVENRPEELFSIMEFIDPTVLGSPERFDRTFITRDRWGKPLRYKNLDVLHRTLGEAMFRKSREDIAEFLPERQEVEVPVPLDAASDKVYRYIAEDLLGVIAEAAAKGVKSFDLMAHYGKSASTEENALKGQIMARITCMRLLACHPELLRASAADFDDDSTTTGSSYASVLKGLGVLDQLPKTSSKMEALLERLDTLFAEGEQEKVVVFSGFKPMIRILGQAFRDRKIGYTSMTGDTPAAKRQERIVRFNTQPSCRVFLSSDAGAYGVNLDSGTHLLNYDLPWSAGALAQRVARIDRTSTKHGQIEIAYLYSARTIEERQYQMLRQKSAISAAFVDGGYDPKDGTLNLELSSLREFLLEG